MDEAEVAVGGFVVSGRQPAGILEFVEASFDHVAQGVDSGIDGYPSRRGTLQIASLVLSFVLITRDEKPPDGKSPVTVICAGVR